MVEAGVVAIRKGDHELPFILSYLFTQTRKHIFLNVWRLNLSVVSVHKEGINLFTSYFLQLYFIITTSCTKATADLRFEG